MCLAIYKPSKVSIDWEALREGFSNNHDGAGFAVAKDGLLDIYKGFWTFDEFKAKFEAFADNQCLIHFRLATHGLKDAKNCHPFLITPNLALIHNGILNIECDLDKRMSDTWHYVEQILQPMAERDIDFYSRSEVQFLGEAAIGYNKFVFLRADGDWHIWNEESGHWHGDSWFSNRSYECNRTVVRHAGFDRKAEPRVLFSHDSYASLGYDRYEEDVEAERLQSLFDPDNSQIYDDLTDRDQQVYDLMLAEGWEVDMLDDLIESHGVNALYDLLKETNYERGE